MAAARFALTDVIAPKNEVSSYGRQAARCGELQHAQAPRKGSDVESRGLRMDDSAPNAVECDVLPDTAHELQPRAEKEVAHPEDWCEGDADGARADREVRHAVAGGLEQRRLRGEAGLIAVAARCGTTCTSFMGRSRKAPGPGRIACAAPRRSRGGACRTRARDRLPSGSQREGSAR